jgi:hypothetical protein
MDDGEARTEGIFYSAIAYEKPMPEALSRPYSNCVPGRYARLIVYPDTKPGRERRRNHAALENHCLVVGLGPNKAAPMTG